MTLNLEYTALLSLFLMNILKAKLCHVGLVSVKCLARVTENTKRNALTWRIYVTKKINEQNFIYSVIYCSYAEGKY